MLTPGSIGGPPQPAQPVDSAANTANPSLDAPIPPDLGVRCPECDYPLTALTEPRCPWCGWAFDLDMLAAAADRRQGRAWGVLIAALVCGTSSAVSLILLLRGQPHLSLWDGLAVVSVAIAVSGHFALAIVLFAVLLHRMLTRHLRAPLLRFAAVFSIFLGIVGAFRMLQPRPVFGVPVESVLEFALVAILYTMPGWTLFALHTIARNNRPIPLPRIVSRTTRDEAQRAPFLVDLDRSLPLESLFATIGPGRRASNPAIDAAIERTWQVEVAIAQEDHRILYNGRLLRLNRWTTNEDRLQLELGATSYREFLGTNVRDEAGAKTLGADFLANPLGVSALVITKDGYLCLGRRSQAVALHAGYLHTFGGMVEDVDASPDGRVDIPAALARELTEELAVDPQEWADARFTGLVRDRELQQPELLFDVSLTLSRDLLRARITAKRPDPEHTAIEYVHDDPESLLAWLDTAGPIAPVAEAALLLHGRHAWGTDWYEQACYLRYGALPI